MPSDPRAVACDLPTFRLKGFLPKLDDDAEELFVGRFHEAFALEPRKGECTAH